MVKDSNLASNLKSDEEQGESKPLGGSSESELHRLNLSHAYTQTAFSNNDTPGLSKEASSLGFFYRLKLAIARRVSGFLQRHVLAQYLSEEGRFNEDLVRHLNQIEKRLLQKELRVGDEVFASIHTLEKNLREQLGTVELAANSKYSSLEAKQNLHDKQLATLDSVARGLERIVVGLGPRDKPVQNGSLASTKDHSSSTLYDTSYLLLENRYRGSEADIKKRLEHYGEVFSFTGESPDSGDPVLEIGAGRGELQEVFKARGITSYGLELDEAMCQRCAQKDLDVRLGDGISHLDASADSSLSGLIAVQVVEHLQRSDLERLLALSRQKVRSGGKVVFETINTRSIVALTQNYFRDPTHVAPLHPETLRYLMEQAGLAVLELKMLSAFPKQAMLQELSIEPYMTPRWSATVEMLNHNTKVLNDLLFGYQDFCVVAVVE